MMARINRDTPKANEYMKRVKWFCERGEKNKLTAEALKYCRLIGGNEGKVLESLYIRCLKIRLVAKKMGYSYRHIVRLHNSGLRTLELFM